MRTAATPQKIEGPDRSLSPHFRHIKCMPGEEAGSHCGPSAGDRPAVALLAQPKPLQLAKSAEVLSPRYYDEQQLNYRFSEFCASVKKPPAGLIESIDAAFEKDKSVGEIWLWIHDIAEKIRTRCGDA